MPENKRLNILFLTPRFPYPLIGGDRLKPYYLLSHLAKKHKVTLVTFYQGGELPKSYLREIQNLGLDVKIIELDPINAGISILGRIFGKLPIEVSYYTQKEYRNTVNQLIEKENYDLAVAFYIRTAEYIKCHHIKKILVAEDCRTLYQKRSYLASKSILQRLIRFIDWKKLSKYEPSIIKKFDISTYVSEQDVEEMQKISPEGRFELLSNGVDIEKFHPSSDFESRKDIIFAGKMDVYSNVLAAQRIVNEILPLVRKEVPDARLSIIGAKPVRIVRNMHNPVAGIEVISNVPDMLPYLQSARVFLHPHWGGSGIQNKLLEAMACGCPVVTTPTGLQGISAKDGEEVLLGEMSAELAQRTIEALQNIVLAEKISLNCRRYIVNSHSWQKIYSKMDLLIESLKI
ncbi:MAG: hypothetical protein HW421_3626 [Ignavibacteria bacterium]|nr:hypothetical protein [Ignavibacteria bacterium]